MKRCLQRRSRPAPQPSQACTPQMHSIDFGAEQGAITDQCVRGLAAWNRQCE